MAASYAVPTDLPEGDGTLEWSSTDVVVVRASAEGEEGLGWTYADRAAQSLVETKLANVVSGIDPMDVPRANEAMVRSCRNLGRPGVAASAISAVDVALWDLKARLVGTSVSALLGQARPDVPVYGSGGFTTYDDKTTTSQLEHWAGTMGIPRVKIKIGESHGSQEKRDLHRVDLARRVVGEDVEVYVDANGAYTRKQAVRMGTAMMERWSVTWFEEPVSSDDLAGLREVRDQCEIDVAAGEYGYSPWYFAPMIVAGAVDCLQADATRCLGYSGWLAVAHLTYAHNLQISGHCAPNLHAHVASCAPNLRHLEYFHDHVRLEQMFFDGVLAPEKGALFPDRDTPGLGLTFKEADAEEFRIA